MMDGIPRGMEVDPITRRPKEKGPSERELVEEKKLESDIAAGLEAEQIIKSRPGKKFVGLIEGTLQERMDFLASQDPECQVLLKLLEPFGRKIQLGEDAARRLTGKRLRSIKKELPNIG